MIDGPNTQVLVWRYGARKGVSIPAEVEEQLRLGHELRAHLVDLVHERERAVAAVWAKHAEVAAAHHPSGRPRSSSRAEARGGHRLAIDARRIDPRRILAWFQGAPGAASGIRHGNDGTDTFGSGCPLSGEQLIARRRDAYRAMAALLADAWPQVVVESRFVAKVTLHPPGEETDRHQTERARAQATLAAPGELVQAIRRATARRGGTVTESTPSSPRVGITRAGDRYRPTSTWRRA